MTDQLQTKAVVTVSEMARMVGLSRARFYQLIQAGVFPQPVYYVQTRRPVYVQEAQEICLSVRRRNCGVNGKPVLFYSRGHSQPSPTRTARTTKSRPNTTKAHTELIDGLAALGLNTTAAQIELALKTVCPNGVGDLDQGELLKAVFLHLKRQDSAGKHWR